MQRKGNALLIAILLTSVLTLLTVSLSELVTSETRQLSAMIQNGKAQYLAEGASEIALYTVHHNDPGFEPAINNEILYLDDTDTNQFSFAIDAKTARLPIVEEYIREIAESGRGGDQISTRDLFAELRINESITIPLESDQFEVQYYLPVAQDVPQSDIDILLWKLFGNPIAGEGTNSMSEFLPAAAVDQINNPDSIAGTRATDPASFGTVGHGWNAGLFFEFSDGDEDIEEDTERELVAISTFLETHENETLVIKNAVNPGLLNISELDISVFEASTIKYRICAPNCSSPNTRADEGLVPEFTTISSSGKFSQTEKQLFTSVNREGFLPIFDFSIYRTVK